MRDMLGTMEALFLPRGVAVVGASERAEGAGTRTLTHLRHFGFLGGIYPVTPNYQELQGFPAYPSLEDVPDPVDLSVIAVRAELVPDMIRQCGLRGIHTAIVYATGFADDELRGALTSTAREWNVRILGPNTLGIRVLPTGLFATFAHDIEGGTRSGSVAVVAQSGGLGVYLGAAYLKRRLTGTRYLVDLGNESDIDAADVLEYLSQDPGVSCVGLLMEGSRNGTRLCAAVEQAVAAGTPVVLFKIGRSPVTDEHIASHTGNLASRAEVFEAALRDAGAQIARIESDFVDALAIHDAGVAPNGRRLGVVSPSGGYAILTLDAIDEFGMDLARPSIPPDPTDAEALTSGRLTNPYDWASDGPARSETREAALRWMMRQPDVDAVLLWEAYSMEMPERQEAIAQALAATLPYSKAPLFVSGIATPEFEARLRDLGVILFSEPTRLVRSLSVVAPAPDPEGFNDSDVSVVDRTSASNVILGEPARKLLATIPHVETVTVSTVGEAETLWRSWQTRGFLKVESERFPHKTDLGLIEGPLDIKDVASAFRRLLKARDACGDVSAPIVAQPMIPGIEVAMGGFVDASFGPMVMVALGGIFVEILRDARFARAPVSRSKAIRLILGLRGAPILRGVRGAAPADVDRAADALVALSEFIAANSAAYSAVDINPLIVRPAGRGVAAVDVVMFPASQRAPDTETTRALPV